MPGGMRHAGTAAQAKALSKKREREEGLKSKLKKERYQCRIDALQNELRDFGIEKSSLLNKTLARFLVGFLYEDDYP